MKMSVAIKISPAAIKKQNNIPEARCNGVMQNGYLQQNWVNFYQQRQQFILSDKMNWCISRLHETVNMPSNYIRIRRSDEPSTKKKKTLRMQRCNRIPWSNKKKKNGADTSWGDSATIFSRIHGENGEATFELFLITINSFILICRE